MPSDTKRVFSTVGHVQESILILFLFIQLPHSQAWRRKRGSETPAKKFKSSTDWMEAKADLWAGAAEVLLSKSLKTQALLAGSWQPAWGWAKCWAASQRTLIALWSLCPNGATASTSHTSSSATPRTKPKIVTPWLPLQSVVPVCSHLGCRGISLLQSNSSICPIYVTVLEFMQDDNFFSLTPASQDHPPLGWWWWGVPLGHGISTFSNLVTKPLVSSPDVFQLT